jgi:hypothetical protein
MRLHSCGSEKSAERHVREPGVRIFRLTWKPEEKQRHFQKGTLLYDAGKSFLLYRTVSKILHNDDISIGTGMLKLLRHN